MIGRDRHPSFVVDRRIRIGLVGCGRISKSHFAAIRAFPDLELVGVCDVVEERADAAARENSTVAFKSIDALLSESNADAIVICTPSGLHPRHGILAAKAGKHVVSEKPMATRLEDADALVRACDEAGVHLFVVKQNRLNPAVRLLKRAITKGRFGRINIANSTVRWSRPQDYYDQARWRGTWEFDGGAFMNQASHYVDMIQWLVGPVESVMAKTGTLARHIEAEDTGVALLKFRSGALGVIEVTMLTYPRNLEGSVSILGEKGSVKIGGTAMNRIETWDFSEYDDDDREAQALKIVPDPLSIYGSGHFPYYENVLQCLRGVEDPGTDGRDGRKSLELILAIYEAAKTNREVSLPLRTL